MVSTPSATPPQSNDTHVRLVSLHLSIFDSFERIFNESYGLWKIRSTLLSKNILRNWSKFNPKRLKKVGQFNARQKFLYDEKNAASLLIRSDIFQFFIFHAEAATVVLLFKRLQSKIFSFQYLHSEEVMIFGK